MTSAVPIFPRQKLSHLTDSGITNLLDSTKLLTAVQPVTSSNGQPTGHTVQPTPEQQALSSSNSTQRLTGKLDDGHRLNFVITVAPRKDTSQPELKSLHIYFTFPVLGTVRVRSTSNLVDDKGNSNTINFSFGPYLSGSATVKFLEDQKANVTYQYTAMGRKFEENSVDVPLFPPPSSNN